MRKKLLLALSGALISFSSFADLGSIRVNSSLNQNLNAVIPITGVTDAQTSGLSIGLANSARFKSNGITFNPELGSLLFKVISNGNNHYLVITSSKPIKSPVLNILLHYSYNSDDYYRQYTVLLDPIDETTSASPAVISVKKTNQPSYAHPIPVKAIKPVVKTSVKPDKLGYKLDLTNPFVKAHLKNFDQDNMSYTTNTGDTLYTIARFEQLIYPQAKLDIMQLLIALGFENYTELKPVDDPYESGFEVLLPDPRDTIKINSDDADQYLLITNPDPVARKILLEKMASRYDSELNIESSELFTGKKTVIASAPVKKLFKVKPPVQYYAPDPTIIDQLLDFKFYILGLIVALGGLLVARKKLPKLNLRRKSANKKDNNGTKGTKGTKGTNNDILDLDDGVVIEHRVVEPLATDNNPNDTTTIPSKQVKSTVIENRSVNIANPPVNLDQDLVDTLEQILSFDYSRNDIRFKLFEIYLFAGLSDRSDELYEQLMNSLEDDSPLRSNIVDAIDAYNSRDTSPVIANDDTEEANLEIVNSFENFAKNNPDDFINEASSNVQETGLEEDTNESYNLFADDDGRVLNFATIKPTDTTITTDEKNPTFSSDRILDFKFNENSNTYSTKSTPSAVDDSLNNNFVVDEINDFNQPVKTVSFNNYATSLSDSYAVDDSLSDIHVNERSTSEELNLAYMYYQIDESERATEILNQILNNPESSKEDKQEALKMIKDFGLDV